jgi:lipocalin
MSSWTLSTAQILGTGNCPKVNVTENFSLPRFLGTYYEVRAYPHFYTLGKSCITWNFIQNNDSTINVIIKQRNFDVVETEVGNVSIVRPGVMLISFPKSAVTRADANFYVLATNYSNYMVLYTCANALFVYAQNVWILSRFSALEEAYLEEALSALRAEGISPSYLGITLQTCGQN